MCYFIASAVNMVGASPHHINRSVAPDGEREVADASGNALALTPKPWTQGDNLTKAATVLSGDLIAYATAFELVAPLRDAMMYAPESVVTDASQWTKLTRAFKDCNIKANDTNFTVGGNTLVALSVDSIYAALKDARAPRTATRRTWSG